MKKTLIPVLAATLLAGAYSFGPRVDTHYSYADKPIPQDVETYIAQEEARFDDIVPGTEKRVVWADQPGVQTPYSVVYLHGFSSSRQDTAPLAETVATRLGANLYEPRFRGHGRPGESMKEVTVNDWFNDAMEAYEIGTRIGEKVVLIGLSTGGTYALWLAAQPETDKLASVTLISPNLGPADTKAELVLLPWGAELARMVEGDYRQWKPRSKAHGEYWTTRYPIEAVVTMMGVVDVTRNQAIEQIQTPILTMYSENDRVVDTDQIQTMLARLPESNRHSLVITESGDPKQHVIAGDVLSPQTTDQLVDEIVRFVSDNQQLETASE